jgi:hypothetical protein
MDAVGRARGIAEVLVHVVALGRGIATIPGAGVDVEFAREDQEVWVADVAFGHAEAVDLPPFRAVTAGENEDGGSGIDHVSVRARAEGKVVNAP